jgi:hypothetical protein
MQIKKQEPVKMSLCLSAEALKLIHRETKRTGKTVDGVINDLILLHPLTEIEANPYDPDFVSQIIEGLVIEHLKVN